MKTIRELLLARHRSAEPQLDKLRHHVVMGIAREAADSSASGMTLARRLWHELFWSCRRVWCGLGAAWLVILLLNLASRDPQAAMAGARSESSAQLAQEFQRRRQQLMAELGVRLETPPPAEPPKPSLLFKPRSESRAGTGLA